ncbi:hypothetical protein CISIN_1g016976mg [Citrus sinensis]|uniref:AT-hook motif nuclear-localized protein n=1 Tax=Citrus sinensis TaxID=2711 RepID=A0A067E803_CITSI|nr:hypothetical protein CISIN_1g016976mg [Citrus sinensis]
MEPNDTQQLQQLNSYFHHPTATTTSGAAATTGPSPTNGLLPSQHQHHNNNNNNDGGGGGGGMVYPHSVASSAMTSTLEPAKKKRGRPRKYGTPEQALAAKKTAAYSNSKGKREQRELHQQQQQLLGSGGSGSSYSGAPGKSQLGGIGNLGQGFTPHVISVAAGEDVGQKIMLFMQQSKREICILSASGSISNASLRQPATSGGNITYELRAGPQGVWETVDGVMSQRRLSTTYDEHGSV